MKVEEFIRNNGLIYDHDNGHNILHLPTIGQLSELMEDFSKAQLIEKDKKIKELSSALSKAITQQTKLVEQFLKEE